MNFFQHTSHAIKTTPGAVGKAYINNTLETYKVMDNGAPRFMCNIINSVTDKDWDFSIPEHGVEYEMLMQQYWIKYMGNSYVSTKQRQYAIDNFDKLNDINQIWLRDKELANVTFDQNNSIAYIDRGKEKTIVAVSGGSWVLNICRGSLEHQYSWMADQFPEYNFISIVEDLSRSHRNPILYDSCLYNGINDELDSIEKVGKYIKELIPNTEYHIIADCKNGHSGAMLAYYIDASRVLLQSSVSHCNYKDKLKTFHNENDCYNINLWANIIFQVILRQIYFCNDVPTHLKSLNNIAKEMPNTKFLYVHHEHDLDFNHYIESVDDSIPNITKMPIQDTLHTSGNHYITLELRTNGFLNNYFNFGW